MTNSPTEENPFEAPKSAEAGTAAATSDHPTLPIELRGDLSVDDYLQAWRLANWTTASLWIRYAFRAILVIPGTLFFVLAWHSWQEKDWDSLPYEAGFGIAIFGCLGFLFYAIRRNVQRHLDSMDAKLGDSPLVVDEVGVHVHGDALSLDYKWEGFEGYRTNGPVMVLYSDYPRMYMGVFAKHAASVEPLGVVAKGCGGEDARTLAGISYNRDREFSNGNEVRNSFCHVEEQSSSGTHAFLLLPGISGV